MDEFRCGISDVPRAIGKDDQLDVKKYVTALEKFVEKCPTPMSIALQGDWGTGKTTFLQSMEEDLKDKVTCIYFNTWQYSQFNMAGELYFSFLSNIVNKISKDTSLVKVKDLKSKVMSFVKSAAKQVIKNKVSESIGVDISDIFNDETERASSIDKLRSDFEELIRTVLKEEKKGGDRIIIFVDDLDRLDPEVAVELLEVMKLFMDVEHCVYVLAIDYEVVVNGVRKKFGSQMSDDKCRSFFDKIIQLPFHMPVENYKIKTMLSDMLNGLGVEDFKNDKVLSIIEEMIRVTIGPNPRTLKRLVNSFTLLKIVNEETENTSDQHYYHTLLLLVLIVQMFDSDAYAQLMERSKDPGLLKDFYKEKTSKDKNENSDNNDGSDEKDPLTLLFESINDLAGNGNVDTILDTLQKVLTLSAITHVEKAPDKPLEKTISTISFNGDEMRFDDTNQKEAMKISFEQVLAYAENNGFTAENMCALANDTSFMTLNKENETSSVFRAGFNVTCAGVTAFVGTSLNEKAKKDSIRKMIKTVNSMLENEKKIKVGSMIWRYPDRDEIIF